MKKIFFPAMAAMALGLASCSSDSVTPGTNGEPAFSDGGFAKVAIALPTQSNSNRAANDKFDDGLASEYKVNKATLVLFQGNNETDAKFHSAYNLAVSMEGYDDTPNQITSTTKIVKRVNDGDLPGDKLYAMVILNGGSNVYVGSDNVTDVHIYGQTMDNTTTIATLQNLKVWDSTNFTSDGILMMNAPLATNPGGANTKPADGTEIHTLVNFTNAVYKTEAEAQSKPATDVYVERAVAKVTMQSKTGTLQGTDVKFKDGTASTIAYSVDGWDLDVTNKVSYLSRNTSTGWNQLTSNGIPGSNYRFIGSFPVKQNLTNPLYRTYFAQDPNFEGAVDLSQFTYLPADYSSFSEGADAFGDEHPKYCFENTFNVANQNQDQTTRVVVKVKVGDGHSFYTFNGDKSTLYLQDKMEARIKAAIMNDADVIAWWKLNGGGATMDASNITLDLSGRDATTGKVLLKSFTLNAAGATPKEFDPATGETSLNARLGLGDIVEYAGGYAYYPIRIKHFGDDLTPWNETETPKPIAGTIYPTTNRQANYLGRYGVLRNNWYDIAVSSISGLGDATVPSVTSEPDDELYNYIAVRINILSWAKRQQNADL